MKITRVEAIPVCVPLKKGWTAKTAHGEHAVSPYVIVKVHTDAGLVGLGEATISGLWSGETQAGSVAAIRDYIAPQLVGTDPRDITAARRAMDFIIKLNPFTKAAVEMALWDISGKAVGRPVYQLLGGRVRDHVRIKLVVWARDVAGSRAMAEGHLALGVSCVKVKVGLDPDTDVARVRAVREVAGPDVPLTIDANCGWTIRQARHCLRALADTNLLLAEQPIPAGDPAALAELRHVTDAAIMADESVFTLQDAWLLTTHRAADILSVYPGKHGGIAATAEIVAVAKAAGIRCTIGSNLELGIGTAAMLHVAAAFPEIDTDSFPADTIGPFYHDADLITQPLDLGPPYARVPDGPGLGVELDEEQLKRWRVG
ncbi:mandelate racemase/muconate lactonizing enzyme family protein [Urbifossiella limnaea]|uniref:L-Ala-D/L-Glu epimerase n=1 Tax=Urbifossiella limnaea TaxID=2528023 RepID=A0A517XRV2_9BACT|nr:enolase C-terminal domain-like protein [Urbifossiella limnaea]QDU20192.1 L-Ala-D/L-Glu epimerase [Urbifossiella limnaea]